MYCYLLYYNWHVEYSVVNNENPTPLEIKEQMASLKLTNGNNNCQKKKNENGEINGENANSAQENQKPSQANGTKKSVNTNRQ